MRWAARVWPVACLTLMVSSAAAQEMPQTGAPAEWAIPALEPQVFTFIQADRLEGRRSDGEEAYLLEAQGWVGTDTSKFWGKVDGDGAFEEGVERVELQALYSRMMSPFFDLQVGLRQDVTPGVADRTHAVVGVQGLAPYWFELEGAFFVSHTGDVTARLEAEYELLFSQRVVLQSRIEFNAAFREIEALGIGSGLSSAEAALRLRYEIRREFAPYVGVSWRQTTGGTADLARAAGGRSAMTSFVAGLRLWY
ncbi:copper resistance protein B [bacterium AH-315-O15]|nr:copper resistance protein B [bacterium AH-315-O15]